MSYQFHKIKSYSRTAAKSSSSGFSAQDIANEAERKPSACKHVEEPMPPTLLYGVMPSQAVTRAHEWAAQAKDVRGSKLRADALCIVAGVVSVPAGFDQWDDYKRAVIDDLLDQYGDRLKSVVEHNDEAYPHMHYYLVPKDGEAFEKIHQGLAAKFAVKYAKKTTGEQNLAYKAAMKNFQTGFYERVSKPFGLLRDGPKRKRLSTPEWRVAQAAAKRDAQMMKETEAKCQSLTLAALEASAGQSAAERVDALARLKIEMENLRIKNKIECEADTKMKMDQVQAETQAAAIKLAEAEAIKVKAVQEATTTEQASKAKIKADEQKYIAARDKFVAKTKNQSEAEKQQAKQAGARIGKAEAEAKYGGIAGVFAVVREAVSSDKADALAELEAKHKTKEDRSAMLIRSYQQAALKATQRADVEVQHGKLKDAEITTLKTKLQALTPTVTQQGYAPGNAPTPRL